MQLIAAVEADEVPDQSLLAEIQDGLRRLGPALMEEARAARATGGVGLQSYLDEFVFRFNRRRTRHAAFGSLLAIAAGKPPVTYKMLIAPEAAA